ncbi:MAG: nucleotidyltransferase domain-containing protein [Planctomycetota bacterium]
MATPSGSSHPSEGLFSKLLAQALDGLPEVRLAYLFGSRARQRARPDSDIDVAVLLDDATVSTPEGRLKTVFRVCDALGTVVSSALVDLLFLNQAPLPLRQRVLRDGILLLARTPEERLRFTLRTYREYQDTEFLRRRWREVWTRRMREKRTDGGSGDLLEKARRAGRLLAKAQGLP